MNSISPLRSPRQRLPALRAFEAVSRNMSVTQAAEELFVTPGAVSQQVRQLEEALGAPLLQRHHRRVSLTPEGVKLAHVLTHCFERIDRTLLEISGDGQAQRLSLRLMPTFAIRWLMPRLSDFFVNYPGVELDISTMNVKEEQLVTADCSIRLGNGQWDDVESDILFVDDLVPICSPALARQFESPADLAKATLIHSAARTEGWQVWFDGHGIDGSACTRNMQVANAAMACQAAIDGLGVAITQREYVQGDLAVKTLVAPFPSYGRDGIAYYLVSPHHKTHWPTVRLFRQWLATHTAQPSRAKRLTRLAEAPAST
jgi:DNA-binding transcriptional LysR family regulator